MRNSLVPVAVALALIAGVLLRFIGEDSAAGLVWAAALIVVIGPLWFGVVRRMPHGQRGADVIALLAMVGALLLGQLLAGLVVALMLSGGELLDERAFSHARKELAALAARAPSPRALHRGDSKPSRPVRRAGSCAHRHSVA